MHDEGCGWQLAKHDRSITSQIVRVRQQYYLNLLPLFTQSPRRHESIAAIISLAAKNHDAHRRGVMQEHIIRDGCARIFHQRERRHAEALAGSAINSSHFGRADNLHDWIAFILLIHLSPDYKTKRPSAQWRRGPM